MEELWSVRVGNPTSNVGLIGRTEEVREVDMAKVGSGGGSWEFGNYKLRNRVGEGVSESRKSAVDLKEGESNSMN